MARSSPGKLGKVGPIFLRSALKSKISRLRRAFCGTVRVCSTSRCPRTKPSEFWRLPLASPQLEAILESMFEADFCPPEQKQARERAGRSYRNNMSAGKRLVELKLELPPTPER